MMKYGLILLLVVNTLQSYGIKRSVNANIHKTHAVGIFGADDVEAIIFGVGMGLPLSQFVGFNFGLCGLSMGGDDVYTPLIAGEAGLIEMLSTRYISVYSTQILQPGLFKKDRKNSINFSLIASAGFELLSGFPINPYIEGGFLIGYEQFALRGGCGLKYSL